MVHAQAPPESATADDSSGPYLTINMDGATLLSITESIAAQTGRNIVPHPSMSTSQTPISIIWNQPVSARYAMEILRAILDAHGYAMIESVKGNLIEIRQRQELTGLQDSSSIAISRGYGPVTEGPNELLIRVLTLDFASAQDASALIQEVGSAAMRTVVYQPTNMLTLIDTADGIRNALELLKDIDIPGYETVFEMFKLEHARAMDIAGQLEQMLSPQGGGLGGATAANAARRTSVRPATNRAQPGSARPATIVGQEDAVFSVMPNERLNLLVIRASAPLMEEARFLIKSLDQETPKDKGSLHVVRLQYANVLDVEQALTAMTSQVTPRGGSGSAFGRRGRSRINSRSRTTTGQTATGSAQATEVQPFEKDVTITAYEPDSSLLITASPQDFAVLLEVIKKLDVPARQVNVQAILMNVAITDQFGLTVETALLDQDDAFALNNVATLANFLASGPLALGGPGATLGFIDGATTIPDPTTGGTISVPNVPLLLQTLETITDLEVLSTPNLLTKDNTPAHFFSGQDIPVPGGTNLTGFVSQSNITRRQAGITLDVTPHVNEGDLVTLEVSINVSQPVASDLGIDPNLTGATFQESDISNEVIIKNGQTGVIGGLMSESRDRSVNQTPILGDLPLIGWLFRSKATGRTKQNLVVLLTPNIVFGAVDMERITNQHIEDFSTFKMDPIFEQGFIKKVKRKHKARTTDHPTDKYKDRGGRAGGSGD